MTTPASSDDAHQAQHHRGKNGREDTVQGQSQAGIRTILPAQLHSSRSTDGMTGRTHGKSLSNRAFHTTHIQHLETEHGTEQAHHHHHSSRKRRDTPRSIRYLHGNGRSDRLRSQRANHIGRSTQTLGYQHHRNHPHQTSHQLGKQNGHPLLLDHLQLQVKRHTQGHHRRLQPKGNQLTTLAIGLVADIRTLQIENQRSDGQENRIQQHPTHPLLQCLEHGKNTERQGQQQVFIS